MKRLFTFIVLSAFVLGIVGCKPAETTTPPTEDTTNAAPPTAEAPAAPTNQ